MKFSAFPVLVSAALVLSACSSHPKADLAKAGTGYGVCKLRDGAACKESLPDGLSEESSGLVDGHDAIVLKAQLSTVGECKDFAAGSGLSMEHYIAQTTINGIIVSGYGSSMTIGEHVPQACALAPFNVVMTVAKGDLKI